MSETPENPEFERWLAKGLDPAAAPQLPDRARFVDQVMRRVQTAERDAPRLSWQLAAPLPWWIQAAADPAAALACVLLALLLWRPDALTAFSGLFTEHLPILGLWLERIRAALQLDRPAIAMGLGILAFFLIGWASVHLFRWTERVTRRAARL